MAFESLANPSQITFELALLLVGLYGSAGSIAVKIRSFVSLMVWGLSIITFIIAIILPIDFVMVWISMIFMVIAIMFSMGVYAMQGRKGVS